MTAYALTARAAVNAAGANADAIADAIADGRSGLRPCLELGDPPPVCGWLDALPPLPAAYAHLDHRATRLYAAAVAPIRSAIEDACTRWGGSRVAAVLAIPIADTDALAVALRLGAPPPAESGDALVELVLGTSALRGPVYACSASGAAGATATMAALRLLDAGLVDAVLTGGCQVLGAASVRARDDSGLPPGEGAALVLLERHGDGFVELVAGVERRDDAAASALVAAHPRAAAEIGHRHVVASRVGGDRLPGLVVATTVPATGDLRAAAGATELVIAAACLERGFVPPWTLAGAARGGLEGDAILVDVTAAGGSVALLLRARGA